MAEQLYRGGSDVIYQAVLTSMVKRYDRATNGLVDEYSVAHFTLTTPEFGLANGGLDPADVRGDPNRQVGASATYRPGVRPTMRLKCRLRCAWS